MKLEVSLKGSNVEVFLFNFPAMPGWRVRDRLEKDTWQNPRISPCHWDGMARLNEEGKG